MMKKTKMLKKNYEFKNILRTGKYFSGRQIEAFIKNNKEEINYLGIAVSVKVAKAVRRNKIKRIMRENYRNFENEIKTSKTIVFLWKKRANIKEATFENIKKDMKNILKKANLFIEEN